MAKNSNNEYESKYEPNLNTNLINKYYPDNSSDSDESLYLRSKNHFQDPERSCFSRYFGYC